MVKKIIYLVLVCLILINITDSFHSLEAASEVAILYDIDNDCVIYEKNAQDVRPVASLTKLMAILVAIEEIPNLDETITVDGQIISGYSEYTKVGLNHGDRVSYKDLLYGMMLPSGADAALLIAHHVSGSEEAFASLMNKKAKALGMSYSHFDNAIGMDSKDNYSSGYDLLKLLNYALRNETFKTMFCTKEYIIDQLDIELETTIRYYTKYSDINTDFIIGSKTGFTDGAGYCLASLVSCDNHSLILITLGADTDVKTSAIRDSSEIYTEFSDNFEYMTFLSKGERFSSLPIKMGWKKKYEIYMPTSLSGFVEQPDNLYYHFISVPEIHKDIKKGDYIGKLEVYQNEKIIGTCDFYLDETIIYHYPLAYISILLISIVILLKVRKRKIRNGNV